MVNEHKMDELLTAVDALAVGLGKGSSLRPDGTGVGGLAFTFEELTAVDEFRKAVLRIGELTVASEFREAVLSKGGDDDGA